jgi:hypothetical protein
MWLARRNRRSATDQIWPALAESGEVTIRARTAAEELREGADHGDPELT